MQVVWGLLWPIRRIWANAWSLTPCRKSGSKRTASPNDPSGGHEDAWTLNPHAIILCLSSDVKILKGIHIALVIFVKDQKKSDWEIYLPRPSKTLVDEHS